MQKISLFFPSAPVFFDPFFSIILSATVHIYVRYLTIDAIMHHTLNIPGTQMTLL